MTDEIIYIVLIEDRHTDVEAVPFRDLGRALEYTEETVRDLARDPDFIERHELTRSMQQAAWAAFVTYSTEGDSVRVVARPVN